MQNSFGASFGFKWLRIGRSQNGVWWIRVRLPFGIELSRCFKKRISNSMETLPETAPVTESKNVTYSKNKLIVEELKKSKNIKE